MSGITPELLQSFARLETNADFKSVLAWIETRRSEAIDGLRAAMDLHTLGTHQGRCAAYDEVLNLACKSRDHLKRRAIGGVIHDTF